MSREAAGDGTPDVAEEIEPAAMASESMDTGEACVTDGASEPDDPNVATLPDEHDEVDPGAGRHDEDDEEDDDDEDEDDEDVPGGLIEMAEPVELDDPGPVLPPPRRWPRLLLALGFVLLAAAIVAGA